MTMRIGDKTEEEEKEERRGRRHKATFKNVGC